MKRGQNDVTKQLKKFSDQEKTNADNVIFMIGSGMSMTTIRAAGMLNSQEAKGDSSLFFEQFPIIGVIKVRLFYAILIIWFHFFVFS
jgi:alkaline phosphatase